MSTEEYEELSFLDEKNNRYISDLLSERLNSKHLREDAKKKWREKLILSVSTTVFIWGGACFWIFARYKYKYFYFILLFPGLITFIPVLELSMLLLISFVVLISYYLEKLVSRVKINGKSIVD